jgi:glycosyltransferase involved in cell wall biosynthesis
VSVARNRGLAASTGALVAFLDDDDLWHPDFLRLQIEAMDADPSACGSCCAGWLIDAQGATISTQWQPVGAPLEELLRGRADLPSLRTMLLTRSDCIAAGGFNPAFRYAEDIEFVFRMVQFEAMAWIPDRLVAYRRYPQSEISTASLANLHQSSRRAITLQIWSAERRDDAGAVRMLEENLQRFNASATREAMSLAAAQFRERHLNWGMATVATALRHEPRSVLKIVASRTWAKVRRRDSHDDGASL